MLFGGFIDESHGNVELINKNKATLKQIAQENAANNGSGANDKKKRKKAAERGEGEDKKANVNAAVQMHSGGTVHDK